MKKRRGLFHFCVVIILMALIFPQGVQAEGDPPQPGSGLPEQGSSPYQEALQEYITERTAAGMPVPSVQYEYQVVEPVQTPMLRSFSAEAQEPGLIVTATTIIYYDNPQEAGYEVWPALDVKERGVEGNLDDEYYQMVEEAYPGYWETHEFGQEPRKEVFVETFKMNAAAREFQSLMEETEILTTDTTNDILMGFTFSGPSIDHTFVREYTLCIKAEKPSWWPSWLPWVEQDGCMVEVPVYSIEAGVRLNLSFGLRLPAQVTVTGPSQMTLGSAYDLSAVLTPSDWTEDQYESAGVAGEDGNEFVLNVGYFIGIDAKIVGHDICQLISLGTYSCHSELGIQKSDSFQTPFGTGSHFEIEAADIKIFEVGLSQLFKRDSNTGGNNNGGNDNEQEELSDELLDHLLSLEAGVSLTPVLSSSEITADWQAVEESDCEGSGEITFNEPNVPALFAVTACDKDPKDEAKITLSNFRYHFNEFSIDFGMYVQLNIIGSIKVGPLRKDIFSVDLDQWAEGAGLYLGKHYQCRWVDWNNPFVCGPAGPTNEIQLSFPTVDLTAPVSSASLSGDEGNNGWYRSDVKVSLSALDNLPGCQDTSAGIQYSLDGGAWNEYTTPFMIGKEGSTILYYQARDDAGNLEDVHALVVKVDKTPPTLSYLRIPAPNDYGWNNTDVTIHFTASDDGSGLDIMPTDPTFTQEGTGQTITASVNDLAGNVTTVTVKDINIDKTPPSLTITSPQAGTYSNMETFITAWEASDALSGLASDEGRLDGLQVQNGQVVELLLVSAGPHTFIVETVDKADNVHQDSVPFYVTTDIDGLIAAKEYLCELGWINKPGICNSLDVKLTAAKNALDRGKNLTAINQIKAFIQELNAQMGKAVDEQAVDLLQTDALYVMEGIK